MKTKYYYINNEGKRVLARTSANEYKYALVKTTKDGKEKVHKCSESKETLAKEILYLTRGHIADLRGEDTKKYYSDQFHDPYNLKLVKLFK